MVVILYSLIFAVIALFGLKADQLPYHTIKDGKIVDAKKVDIMLFHLLVYLLKMVWI